MKVWKTTYDGFYITLSPKGEIRCYEGYTLCPPKIKKIIDKGEVTEIDYFHEEAISYGRIK